MFRRILFTLDGSELAQTGLPVALALARWSDAELRLLSVHDSGWARLHGEWGDGARGRAARYLHRMRELVEPFHPRVTVAVRDGSVAREILQEAEDVDADLIVMTTHGRRPLSRFWLGSVADRCAREAERPLLLVRPTGVEVASWSAASPSVPRVVVALDGSPLAENAIPPGRALAGVLGCPIAFVRVVPTWAVPRLGIPTDDGRVNQDLLEWERLEAERYLAETRARIADAGEASTQHVLVGDEVARTLLDFVGRDPVVMASHARGIERAFLGSVTDAVVRGSAGPVLIVPPRAARPSGRDPKHPSSAFSDVRATPHSGR